MPHEGRTPARKQGFALVLALSMMAFVLVLLLSMTLLVRVESINSSRALAQLRAKESARLALMMALGDLQRYAGPDLKVSARADTQGVMITDPNTQLWTGIWTSDSNGGVLQNPEWLVSGQGSDATQGAGSNSIEIHAATINQEAIRVPMVSIDYANGIEDSFAYWVSDESTKARLNFGNSTERMTYITTDEDKQNVQEEYLHFPAQDKIFKSLDPLDDTTTKKFQRIIGRENVSIIAPSALLLDTFHDYSLSSASVLINMQNGGMKQNLTGITTTEIENLLSETTYTGDTYLAGDYLNYFNIDPNTGIPLKNNANAETPVDPQPKFNPGGELVRSNVSDFFDYRANQLDSRDGITQPVANVMPVISEVAFRIGAFHTQRDAKHRIRFHADVEFWNPYPYPIRMPSDSEGFYKDRCFVVMLIPSVIDTEGNDTEKLILSINNVTKGRELHTNLFDFDELLGSVLGGGNTDNTLNETVLQSWMVIEDVILQPGEVYHATTGQSTGLSRDSGGYIHVAGTDTNDANNYVIDTNHDYNKWSWHTVANPTYPVLDPDDQIELDLRMPDGGLTFRIIDYSSNLQNSTSPVYEDDTGNTWATPVWELRNIYKVGNPPTKTLRGDEYSRSRSGSYALNNFNIGFHFRLADELVFGSTSDASDLTLRFDLRQPVWDFDDPAVAEIVEITEDNPFNVSALANLFDGTDVIADANSDSHGGKYERAFLFSAPKREPLSVGALHRLPLSYETVDYDIDKDGPDELVQKRIGMPWGGNFNEIFDKYFYTGAPNTNWTEDMPLPLAQLKPIAETTSAELRDRNAANKLLMEGGFNINSTSIPAWEAMLSRTIYDWDHGDLTTTDLENAFLNLSDDTDTAVEAVGLIADESKYNGGDVIAVGRLAMEQSIRQLSDTAITQLATEIVNNIKDHVAGQSLFSTVSEFVNSGIIDQAILDANINGTIAQYSPAYISQNLILEMLAPYLTTRGDTFTIRTYGSASNPATRNVASEVWCEAIVQRMPDRVDSDSSRTQQNSETNGNLFGRRFEIVDLKWITPN